MVPATSATWDHEPLSAERAGRESEALSHLVTYPKQFFESSGVGTGRQVAQRTYDKVTDLVDRLCTQGLATLCHASTVYRNPTTDKDAGLPKANTNLVVR